MDEVPIEFQVVVTIDGSNARFDFREAPDAQPSPTNCPQPTTVCASRIILAMLAGKAQETPNEGSFRPPEVVTRPGSMFHPVEPQPCYLYAWPAMAAMEGIAEIFASATDGAVPSGSAGDIVGVMVYGIQPESSERFIFGGPLPVGHGAFPNGDGTTLYHLGVAHAQLQSPELQEAKTPVLFEKWEFAPDSGGPGEFRGGSGWDIHVKMLNDASVISTVERTQVPSWAQKGGLSGAPNRFEVDFPDGHTEALRKVTDKHVPKGSRLRYRAGGGGGYGDPINRAPAAVQSDLLDGMVTVEHARRFYADALGSSDGAELSPTGPHAGEQ
jgi:N-methylhydantoinase B